MLNSFSVELIWPKRWSRPKPVPSSRSPQTSQQTQYHGSKQGHIRGPGKTHTLSERSWTWGSWSRSSSPRMGPGQSCPRPGPDSTADRLPYQEIWFAPARIRLIHRHLRVCIKTDLILQKCSNNQIASPLTSRHFYSQQTVLTPKNAESLSMASILSIATTKSQTT